MIKKVKYLLFFLIFLILCNCSFDNKTGIWKGDKDEIKRVSELEKKQKEVLETIQIYSSTDTNLDEIKTTKNIILSKAIKNTSWESPNLNIQNFTGNLYLSGIKKNFLKKKIGKNKFIISPNKSSPIIYNNTIIFSDDVGTIYSISQRGKINWKKNIYKKIYKKIYKNLTISIYKDKIYVADNIGFIYSINLSNGKVVWIKNHGIPFKSQIKVFENKIFLINHDNRVICLDIEKGSKLWDVRAISSFIKTQNFLPVAISQQGDVVALTSSGDLLKLNSMTGQVYWSLNITGSTSGTDFFRSSEIVIHDNEIIFSGLSKAFSFDLSNGYLNWEKNIGPANTPIVDGNNIFLITNNGYFINLNRDSGEIIWSTNILKILKKKKRNTQISGFIMGSGKIYATTLNGYLIVCSANSGKIEFFKKIGGQIAAEPIISNGSLYILTEKPMITGFN